MIFVKPKKSLGQHFLKDKNIAEKIVKSLHLKDCNTIVEVGPGMGVLTQFLVKIPEINLSVVEVDGESVEYLKNNYPELTDKIIHEDFLHFEMSERFKTNIAIIGNFPYNISSQIFFKVLENKNIVTEVVGMIQKEVAERISAPPGSKTYGILSVLLQAFYKIEYLFTVNETVFIPPPKVKSAVIRLIRNETKNLNCDEIFFFKVVKAGFNQRRKTLRNSLKTIMNGTISEDKIFDKRPEQLSVDEFIFLTNLIRKQLLM